MRREIHDHEVELRALTLPLDNDEVLRRWVAWPGGVRLEQLTLAPANRGGRQQRQPPLIHGLNLRVACFPRAARELNRDPCAGSAKLALVKEAQSRQAQGEQGGRPVLLRR